MVRWYLATALMAHLVLGASIAQGDFVTYTDWGNFDAAGYGGLFEDFEGGPLGPVDMATPFDSGLAIWHDSPQWQLAVTDQNVFSFNTTQGGSQHLGLAFGSDDVSVSFGLADDDAVFTDAGFNITGYQDMGGSGGFDVTFLLDGALISQEFAPFDGIDPDGILFFGFAEGGFFDEMRITIEGGDFVGFDDIVFSVTTVPAPGALILLLSGIAVLSPRRRA